MDIEKVKKSFEWDPSRGDYSKSHVSYERRILQKKYKKRIYFLILYMILIILAVIILFVKFL